MGQPLVTKDDVIGVLVTYHDVIARFDDVS
jgi:hypothetical protein